MMRVFQQLDVTDALSPHLFPILGAEFIDTKGQRIIGLDTEVAVEGPMSWVTDYLFHQPSLEAVLRDTVAEMPNVDILDDREVTALSEEQDAITVSHEDHAREVTALSDAEDAITVSYEDHARGTRDQARGRYLIGCDGARSFVRKSLNLGFESLGFDQEWLVVDVVMKREKELPRILQQVCDPARPVTVVPDMGVRRRWELQLRDGETKEEMERPERVWQLLSPWIEPDDADLERAVVYEFHGLVAPHWRSGRAFIAGDAAHQMPPFMGQGMCSGIRDAANLAWKMDLVFDGICDDRLLDMYETEREPHARHYVDHSVAAGRLIDTLAAEAAGLEVEVDDSAGYGGTREAPYLQHGVLRPRGDDDPFTGRLFVQPRVKDEDGEVLRLDELLGSGFALVSRHCPLGSLSSESLAFLERIGARSQAVPKDREIGGLLDAYLDDDGIVIVRPDRYVFTVAHGIQDLEAALVTLRDMLALTSR
jgi:3-(3-hydroxy-phenyl)propionate hydroxylase